MVRTCLLVFLLALSGCVTYAPSIPEDYIGPTAQLEDSFQVHGSTKADFFVAEKINGANVDNALMATIRANQGMGMYMQPVPASRLLVAGQPVKVSLRGRTHYAAPILALAGVVHQVRGVIEFTPQTDRTYVIHGSFSEEKTLVWIADNDTQQIVGNSIEIQGSTKLGFFQK